MVKYYHAENAARGAIGGVVFQPYDIVAGSVFGIYAAEEGSTQGAALDSLVLDSKSAVTSIGQGEYEKCLAKKKPPIWNGSAGLRQILPTEQARLKGQTAAVVVNDPAVEEEKPIEISVMAESAEDALQVGPVEVAILSGPAEALPKNLAKGKRENQ